MTEPKKSAAVTEIMLKDVRLAFPNLFEAKQFNGQGKARYNATLLIPKASPLVADIKAAMIAAANEKWTSKSLAVLKALQAQERTCFRDGDIKYETKEYDGFENHFYISAANASRPMVLNRDKSQLTEADGVIYAGCYVNAKIRFWAQDNNWGQRINATLQAVQFNRDGDAFAGGPVASPDDFEDLSVGEAPAASKVAGDDLF